MRHMLIQNRSPRLAEAFRIYLSGACLLAVAWASSAAAEWSCLRDDQGKDYLYELRSTEATWAQAQADCRADGGSLASVHSEDDNKFVTQLCFSKCWRDGTCDYRTDCWIGLNDKEQENQFAWADGSSYDWQNPHLNWNREKRNCFHLEGHYHDGTWEGDFCSKVKPAYICKIPRIRPATDGSGIENPVQLRVEAPIGLRASVKPAATARGYAPGTQVTIRVRPTHEFYRPEGGVECKRADGRDCGAVVPESSDDDGNNLTVLLTLESDTTVGLSLAGRCNQVPEPGAAHSFWNRDTNMAHHKTADFMDVLSGNPRYQLIVRRGQSFTVTGSNAMTSLEVRHCSAPGAPAETWAVNHDEVVLPPHMGVGVYEVQEPENLRGDQVVVLFNPYLSGAPEFFRGTQEATEAERESERRTWIADSNTGVVDSRAGVTYDQWPLDLYDPVVFRALMELLHIGAELAGGDDADDFLGDPWRVLRSFTWLFHDRQADHEGVAHGQWQVTGSCCPYRSSGQDQSLSLDQRICLGTGAVHIGARSWISDWLDNNQRAVYPANCQDFAGLFCAASRSLGVACRIVTGKRIGQEELPSDRVLDLATMDRTATDPEGCHFPDPNCKITELERTARNNAIWLWHTWPEVFLSSSKMSPSPEWYVAEPTPSVVSQGRHQLGPIPLSLVKANDTSFADPELRKEIELFIAQTKGYVWMGRKAVREALPEAVASLLPASLAATDHDGSFDEWKRSGYNPPEFACFLVKGITLEGYKGASFDDPMSMGHVTTMNPHCNEDLNVDSFPFSWPTYPHKFEVRHWSGAEGLQCILRTTNLYKSSLTEGPFEGGPAVDPFAALRRQQNCPGS